jgi:hypothetical protein
MDERMEAILEHVRAGFRESGSHGLDHTLRVARLCEMLGAEEGADMDVLVPDRSRRGCRYWEMKDSSDSSRRRLRRTPAGGRRAELRAQGRCGWPGSGGRPPYAFPGMGDGVFGRSAHPDCPFSQRTLHNDFILICRTHR